MARPSPTGVKPSAYEAKLHATAERQQSMIAGWTPEGYLRACFGQGLPAGPELGFSQKLPELSVETIDFTSHLLDLVEKFERHGQSG